MSNEKHEGQHLTPGFTPIPDTLVVELDLITAAVLGRIWRFEQGSKHKCFASKETLGKSLGISPKTIQRRLRILTDLEYLRELTPTRRHQPREYRLSKKAKKIMYTALGRSERPTSNQNGRSESPAGRSESPSRWVRESLKETNEETIIKKEISGVGDDGPLNDHQHILSSFSKDDFEKVKNEWLEVVGKMSVSHEKKLKKYVEEFSTPTVLEAIEKMGNYAEIPNPAYLEKVLTSLTREPQGKYTSGKFAEFVETG